MKKVTVIIPTYKRSKFLIRALESVLNQTYKNIEIIIVDDNGINTEYQKINEKKLEKYIKSGKIIYLKHIVNKNGASARNTGIKHSTGDYITFLDDDDFFLSERIEYLVKKIEENVQFDAVYSSMLKIKNNHIYNYRKAHLEENLMVLLLNQYSFFGTGSNMFFTRKSIEKIGMFDERFYRYQDFEYMIRFFEAGFKIGALDKILVVKCEEDNMNIPQYDKMMLAKEMFIKKFEHLISKYDENKIKYNIYKELYIFSESEHHEDSKKYIKKFDKIKISDMLTYLYNKLVIKFKFCNLINYKIREIRCLGKYNKKDKNAIFKIINHNI